MIPKTFLTMVPLIRYQPAAFHRVSSFSHFLSIMTKTFTTTSLERAPSKRQTCLAWRQLHDRSPGSYGVRAFDGNLELIPPKTPLPCKRTELMENALDYVTSISFGICCRRTILDLPVEIAEDAVLHSIRPRKEGDVKFEVTMGMEKDLMGIFTVEEIQTENTVSVEFDGAKWLQIWLDDYPLITGPN